MNIVEGVLKQSTFKKSMIEEWSLFSNTKQLTECIMVIALIWDGDYYTYMYECISDRVKLQFWIRFQIEYSCLCRKGTQYSFNDDREYFEERSEERSAVRYRRIWSGASPLMILLHNTVIYLRSNSWYRYSHWVFKLNVFYVEGATNDCCHLPPEKLIIALWNCSKQVGHLFWQSFLMKDQLLS